MERIDRLKAFIKELPITPGVYLMKNAADKVIYVGKAKDLRARVRSYFQNSKDISVKTKYLVAQIEKIDYMLTKTEVEAFLLEASLIKKHRPRYNIRLKDDKAYPYIRVSMEVDFPRFYLSRKVRRDGAYYFGPYTSGFAVREVIRFLNRTFKIRDCTDSFFKTRKRPCMTYQIGRCTAPCVNLISREDYRKDIDSALEFLRGQDAKLLKDLNRKMKKAAQEERFEAAAKLRDSIGAVEQIWEKQAVVSTDQDVDQDVIAYFGDNRGTLIETVHIRKGRLIGNRAHFLSRLDVTAEGEDPREWLTSFINQYYTDNIIPDEIILPVDLSHDIYHLMGAVFRERQGKTARFIHALDENEKGLMDIAMNNAKSHFNDHVSKQENRMRALEEIQAKFKLPELPRRMECYDISNFQGSQTVGSQVVFEDGLPKSEDYRRYRIRTVEGSNDFASMKEMLERRLRHTEYDEPQLIVVDGGKGQLKMALEALREIGRPEIPVVGIAKARTKGEFSDQEVSGTEERFFLPGRTNPVTFVKNSEALQILVNLRDEAHRFAITYHRQLREKESLESELDAVVGLGPKRKKQLLLKFPSIEAVRTARPEEIAKIPGFNLVLAERILLQLNPPFQDTVVLMPGEEEGPK